MVKNIPISIEDWCRQQNIDPVWYGSDHQLRAEKGAIRIISKWIAAGKPNPW